MYKGLKNSLYLHACNFTCANYYIINQIKTMQNKGFVKVFAIALTVICLFYLSFTFRTRSIEKAAAQSQDEQAYLDSVMNKKVWLGIYSFRECREMQIGLGLDLKGGMNVILEVSIPDVVKSLAGNTADPDFAQALSNARQIAIASTDNFVDIFYSELKKVNPNATMSSYFATSNLKERINVKSTDEEVIAVLKEEVNAAVGNAFNVLRTRIDRFGVAQPNIQELAGKQGRIMVELPGIKEPERVRKLLQGSANLEFWETYKYNEIADIFSTADSRLRVALQDEQPANAQDTVATEATEEVKADSTDLASQLLAETAAANADMTAAQQKAALMKTNPLLALLQPSPYDGCVVGICHYSDTAKVNEMLAPPEVKPLLPRDLKHL